jgi:molybdate transport system ATP-binding protein
MLLDLDIRKTLGAGKQAFELDVRLKTDSQRIVILGPSGSGKSLTLKAIAGLLRPDAGHIRLDGRVLFDAEAGIDLAPQRRELAYVFQDYALFPHLTVRQNIAFPLVRGWCNPRRRQRHEHRRLLVRRLPARSAWPASIRMSCRAGRSSAPRWRAPW